jgi:hypothetical protein
VINGFGLARKNRRRNFGVAILILLLGSSPVEVCISRVSNCLYALLLCLLGTTLYPRWQDCQELTRCPRELDGLTSIV